MLLPHRFSFLPAAASPSTGLYQPLLHLAKLTGLLGSPETRHLTDLLTVSPPQITPSLSAHITLPSPCLHELFFHRCVFCMSHFFPVTVSTPCLSLLPLCIIPCHCTFYISLTIFLHHVTLLLPVSDFFYFVLFFSLPSLPLLTIMSSLFHPFFYHQIPVLSFLASISQVFLFSSSVHLPFYHLFPFHISFSRCYFILFSHSSPSCFCPPLH